MNVRPRRRRTAALPACLALALALAYPAGAHAYTLAQLLQLPLERLLTLQFTSRDAGAARDGQGGEHAR